MSRGKRLTLLLLALALLLVACESSPGQSCDKCADDDAACFQSCVADDTWLPASTPDYDAYNERMSKITPETP